MFKYNKTLAQLFEEKPKNLAALLAALEEAIALHQEIVAARKAEEKKMQELKELADAGSGVKAMRAKAELEQMRVRSQTGANMADVRARFKKRQAQKNYDKGDPLAEEMKALKVRQDAEAEAKRKEKEESRARLAAKIKAMGAN